MLEPDGLDVSRQMVNRDNGPVQGSGGRFRERHAHQQRPDQAWTLRDGDGINAPQASSGIGQRALHDTADVTHVLARCQLRHHAAPLAVHVVCDAMMFDRTRQGRAGSPVVETTAAAVSSHDVSIPSTVIALTLNNAGRLVT